MISRLAPTPSGYLHWGNLCNFALTSQAVRNANGTLWLRIDDIDASRMRPEYVEDIFETLNWLGLNWDQGPRNSDEFFTSFSQSLRHKEYWNRLQDVPTYACDCSRSQIQARGSSAYDGYCRSRNLEFRAGATSLRICLRSEFADPVLWTRQDRAGFHWVSILDDLRMGTTHLIRGEDLRETSEIQKQIARLAGENRYESIKHVFHPLLTDSCGRKLSKSENADSIAAFRVQGGTPAQAWNRIWSFIKSES